MAIIPLHLLRGKTPQELDAAFPADDLEETLAYLQKNGTLMPRAEAARPDMTNANWGTVLKTGLENFGDSFQSNAQGLLSALSSPVQSAKALYSLGEGAVDIFQDEDTPEAQAAREAWEGTKFSKNNLAYDPVGQIANASALVGGGAGLIGKMAGAGRLARTGGRIAALGDPIGSAIGAGAKAVKTGGQLATDVLGFTTGVKGNPLRQAFKAGVEGGEAQGTFRDFITERRSGVDLIEMSKEAIKDLKDNDAYAEALQQLDLGAQTVPIQPLQAQIRDHLSTKFNVDFDSSGRVIKSINAFDAAERGTIARAFNEVLDQPGTMRADKLNAVKQNLFTGKADTGAKARQDVAGFIGDYLEVRFPQLAEANAAYKQQVINFDTAAKNLGVRPNDRIASKKELSGLTTGFRDNADAQAQAFAMVERETGVPIQSAAAGHLLSQLMPTELLGRGAAIGAFTYGQFWSLPLFSPRIVGAFVNRFGQALGGPAALLEKIQRLQQWGSRFGLNRTGATVAQVLGRVLQEQEKPGGSTLLQRLGGPR